MASEQEKRAVKGILKHTSSLDKGGKREVEWDEMNILATHHPPDKDYGHMKIDEPPTPYNKYSDTEDDDGTERRGSTASLKEPPFDASQLASRLIDADDMHVKTAHVGEEEESSEEENETEEERATRKQFELKRKLHYNEFAAVQLAKRLMEEEDEEDDDENDSQMAASTGPSTSKAMETDSAGPSSTCQDSQVENVNTNSDTSMADNVF